MCCGADLELMAGVKATGVEAEMLAAHGYVCLRSNDDAFYVKGNRFVWLYPNETWSSTPRPLKESTTLEDYLAEKQPASS